MTGVQKAILPGIFISSVMLFQLNSLVNPVQTVKAEREATVPVAETIAVEAGSDSKSCQFQEQYPAEVMPWCALLEEQAALQQLYPQLNASEKLV